MADPTPPASSIDAKNVPRRYIYNQADMEHFRHSSARKELLSFVSAMGRGLAASSSSNSTTNATTTNPAGGYHPLSPLENLTPALASLHGSLSCMSKTWMDPNCGGIPPDFKVKARFGNPEFRTWHARLVERSYGVVRCLMDCHVKYSSTTNATAAAGEVDGADVDGLTKEQILKECSEQGYNVASNEGHALFLQQHKESSAESPSSSNQEDIIAELRAYLHDSFGHPIRIDYGTGHESSFIVFLLSLCKIGCFRWGGANKKDNIDNNNGCGDDKIKSNPPPEAIGLASLSLFHAYLNLTRGLQRDYMLEPAGSHGVWGLDDYHCVPFYLGACQMMAREQWQEDQRAKKKINQVKVEPEQGAEDEVANRMPDNPYLPEASSPGADQPTPVDTYLDNDIWAPSIIHDRPVLETQRSTYLYLSCIYFIQQIKPKVPFFESSPMLNDISQIGGGWAKVSSGLLRLYEGEVLDKTPVVQHFVFGKIFSANWSPSRKTPLEAPKKTFINGPMGEECIAPWASGGDRGDGSAQSAPASASHPGGMPPTRAPWAK